MLHKQRQVDKPCSLEAGMQSVRYLNEIKLALVCKREQCHTRAYSQAHT